MTRKTTRRYGAIVARIRKLAASGRAFSREDLPWLDRKQATSILQWMKATGELVRVRNATMGCKPTPAMFKRNKYRKYRL